MSRTDDIIKDLKGHMLDAMHMKEIYQAENEDLRYKISLKEKEINDLKKILSELQKTHIN